MAPLGPNSSSDPIDGLTPRRAPVIPRVRTTPGGAALPLERRVRALLEAGAGGYVNLYGPPGSGKATALRHLACALQADPAVHLQKSKLDVALAVSRCGVTLIVVTSDHRRAGHCQAWFELVPWGDDELIEYLVATRRDRCAAVMKRVTACDSRASLSGLPGLWRVVLDRMADDDSIPDVTAALRAALAQPLSDPRLLAARRCLSGIRRGQYPDLGPPVELPDDARLLLRYSPTRLLLAAECLVADLCDAAAATHLQTPLPPDLVAEAAKVIRHWPEAMSNLEAVVRGGPRQPHAMAASLLVAAQPAWRPEHGKPPDLARAYLAGVRWSGLDLCGMNAFNADLSGADLRGCDLDGATVQGGKLCGSKLRGAAIHRLQAIGADFSGADLTAAKARQAVLSRASLVGANLTGANLEAVRMDHADLTGATLVDACLVGAVLDSAKIEGADFRDADLTGASLPRVRLSSADFVGACFQDANLGACDLEHMELPEPIFTGAKLGTAVLTGSVMPGADFRRANLSNTGLADIDWAGADLRGADLRGATFHLGSTRSGLVGSTLPCEGSRTGFYTDDYDDRDFKPPEEIRKANLCGADLRGANVDGVDFYLVDLRGAKYSDKQAVRFARCKAILH
jgi:uncharacterized protein YjbI with pentapeptide repeats